MAAGYPNYAVLMRGARPDGAGDAAPSNNSSLGPPPPRPRRVRGLPRRHAASAKPHPPVSYGEERPVAALPPIRLCQSQGNRRGVDRAREGGAGVYIGSEPVRGRHIWPRAAFVGKRLLPHGSAFHPMRAVFLRLRTRVRPWRPRASSLLTLAAPGAARAQKRASEDFVRSAHQLEETFRVLSGQLEELPFQNRQLREQPRGSSRTRHRFGEVGRGRPSRCCRRTALYSSPQGKEGGDRVTIPSHGVAPRAPGCAAARLGTTTPSTPLTGGRGAPAETGRRRAVGQFADPAAARPLCRRS